MKCCVILSVYKNSKLQHVKECLESIYDQTLKADILVNIDGEIDSELEKFLENEYKKNKLCYLSKSKKNKGIAVSYNGLIREALKRGCIYIARMDSDDIMKKDRIKLQYEFLENNPDIDVVGTHIEEFGDDINYFKVVKYPLHHEQMFKFFSKRVPVANVTTFFRRSFFEKAGLYPESGHITNEDTLMWLKGFKNGCIFANIDYIGVRVRVNRDFFNRRRKFKKVWYDFKNRLQVNKELNYGIDSYFYAIVMLIINILPPSLKKIAYKFLR